MIALIFAELCVVVGVRRSCELLGVTRSGHYRAKQPALHGPPRPRSKPANALSDAERAAVLAVLRAPENCELAVAQVWARLLDAGVYLCSRATMYRVLRSVGETGERRRQRTHPAKKRPELIARKPNQVWSWDITKVPSGTRGEYFDLYVIIDIYSRMVVGWQVQATETGELAADFIAEVYRRHQVKAKQLTLHADRGTSMTSKVVAQLLIDLAVERSHSRPHVSNDNPYSEAMFKTLKYCPAWPDWFATIDDARSFSDKFFEYYNTCHYHSGIAFLTPVTVHNGNAGPVLKARAATLEKAWRDHPGRFRRKPVPDKLPKESWINEPHREAVIGNC